MKRGYKKYELNQCALYKCSTQRRLESLLFMDKNRIKKVKEIIQYYSFSQPKKDGTPRKINAPRTQIKQVQKRILNLLTPIIRPEWVISGERGKCYIDNGKHHKESHYFITMDIKKFYDNCKREYVFLFFNRVLCIPSDVAGILTDIVTFEGGVPTGCPTSQLIAYYAYREMFDEIYSIAKENGCLFTLYVDDMTFSSDEPFEPRKIENAVDICLRKYGHRPKYSKVKYYAKEKFKLVTGTSISPDNKLLVSNNLQHKIYINFMELKNQKIENHDTSLSDEKRLLTLKGQLQAARSIDSEIFPEINRLANSHYF